MSESRLSQYIMCSLCMHRVVIAGNIPSGAIGEVGSYAVVATTTLIRIFYRNSAGTWVLVGSDAWSKSWPTIQGGAANPSFAGTAAITIILNHTNM